MEWQYHSQITEFTTLDPKKAGDSPSLSPNSRHIRRPHPKAFFQCSGGGVSNVYYLDRHRRQSQYIKKDWQTCVQSQNSGGFEMIIILPQIALAIGVLTSSIGVRVRRVFGFVWGGGGCRAGCRPRCRLMCVWVRVRRSDHFPTGLP